MSYSIIEKINLLEKVKGSSKYLCPSCGGKNLNIQHSSGAYRCYDNCEAGQVRAAIDLLEGKDPWVPEPTWIKPLRPASKITYHYPDRAGKPLAKVDRIDYGDDRKKDFFQSSFTTEGLWVKRMPGEIRAHIPIYNYQAVREAAGKKRIWVTEGESAAEVLISLGLATTTTIGGSSGFGRYGNYTHDLRDCELVLCPDRDNKGVAYIAEWAEMFKGQVVAYFLAGTQGLWRGLTDGDGMDVADHIADYKITSPGALAEWLVTPDAYKGIVNQKAELTHPTSQHTQQLKIVTNAERRQLTALIALRSSKPDTGSIYPDALQEMMNRDAQRQNIDPAAYSCYLLPAVASLMGRTTLALGGGFDVPNIIWSVLIQPSGGGKSRAESLIKAPLFKWELEAYRSYREKAEAYKLAMVASKKNPSGDLPQKPNRRQYLLEMATPQAVTKVLAENQGYGIAWFRDEIKGLFSSLGQFAAGDGEGIEILLQLWDGNGTIVNRVSADDSYVGDRSRLSIAGGIQPAILSKVFDENDPQGMFARFLPIIPNQMEARLYKGSLELTNELPALYSWIKSQDWEDLILDSEAEIGYEEIYMIIAGIVPSCESNRAWLAKAAGQVGRVAIALHAINCFYEGECRRVVSFETICAAYTFTLKCFEDVCRVAGTLADKETNTSIATCLDKILQKLSKHPEGLSIPDIYRNINSMRTASKAEGVSISAFTLDLCRDLEKSGHCRLEASADGAFMLFPSADK